MLVAATFSLSDMLSLDSPHLDVSYHAFRASRVTSYPTATCPTLPWLMRWRSPIAQ